MFADDPCGGKRKLVAVEYAVPLDKSKHAPVRDWGWDMGTLLRSDPSCQEMRNVPIFTRYATAVVAALLASANDCSRICRPSSSCASGIVSGARMRITFE